LPENVQPVATRRKRYERSPSQETIIGLTPTKVQILRFLAELRFLSLPQLAKLSCPSERPDLSEKSARRHMRALFDAGLVDVLPVPRAALAPQGATNDATLLYGSAPNIYAPTKAGLELLRRAGMIGDAEERRTVPAYGPKNGLFLAHELAVRDVRVWLEGCARSGGHEVECWRDGEEAAIGIGRSQPPFSVRPDAWFVYRLGATVLVGLVEVDRGTERGGRRWGEKLEAYWTLFVDHKALRGATGYVNARVLVFCPGGRRRDQLAELIGTSAEPPLAQRFWLTDQGYVGQPDVTLPLWKQPGSAHMRPLVAQPERS